MLASAPRTGSTWLGRMLAAEGDVGQPKEWLNGMQMRDLQARFAPSRASRAFAACLGPRTAPLLLWAPWTDAALHGYLERVRAVRTSPTGWFAIKLHGHHRRRWFEDAGRRFEDYFSPACIVRVRRRDRLAQAVSWARAMQSGVWVSEQVGHRAPSYDAGRIARCLRAIARDEDDWQDWLDARPGHRRCVVDYEDLVADPMRVVSDLRAALGVAPVSAPPAEVGMRRQADALSAQWIERFRREVGRV